MNTWKPYIMVRLLLPFIAGILLCSKFPQVVLIALFLLAGMGFLCWKTSFQYRWIGGIQLTIALLALGGYLASKSPPSIELPLPVTENQAYSFAVSLEGYSTATANSTRVLARIIEHPIDSLRDELILIYGIPENIEKHRIVVAKAYIQPVSAPKNPGEFNYQKYMAKQQVYYQSFVRDYVLGGQAVDEPETLIERLKQYCTQYLELHLSAESSAIAKALLLGQKQELNAATKQEFARAGTMHILAVSGLHVGIIYLMIGSMLSFFQKHFKVLKPFVPLLLIASIWTFALLTGAKASVIRAATMFTLFALGKYFFGRSNSLNVLAGTAFIMLCLKPSFIYDVGFQLSFTAVLGILLIYPLLRNTWPGGPPVWRYFKGILFVSFCAQVATLPLTVYYFHQVPMYGLVSNLVVVPIAFLLVGMGFLGFLSARIPYVGEICAWIIEFSVQVINHTNSWIAALPHAVRTDLNWGRTEVMAVYVLISGVLLLFASNRKLGLYLSLIGILTLSMTSSIHQLNHKQHKGWTIFALKNAQAIEFYVDGQSVLFHTSDLTKQLQQYSIDPSRRLWRIQESESFNVAEVSEFENAFLAYRHPFIQFGDTLIQWDGEEPISASNVFIIDAPKTTWFKRQREYSGAIVIANKFPNAFLPKTSNMHFLRSDGAFTTMVVD